MILLVTICLAGIYLIMLLLFTVGAIRAHRKKLHTNIGAEEISVIIAARNEERNIANAVNSLLRQDYPSSSFEIIVVDDHSEDETINCIPTSPLIRVIQLDKGSTGKKAALQKGVSHAKFDYIAVTDADCIASPLWLKTMATIIAYEKPALIAGPVTLTTKKNFLAQFQQAEFRALQMVTFGSASIGLPTLCNGANLCFSKENYALANLKEQLTPSGDDIFLLHYLLLHKKKVVFSLNRQLLITTTPVENLNAMLQQKIRWASKSKHITNPATLAAGGITFVVNLVAATSIPLVAIIGHEYLSALIIWITKLIAETILVYLPGKKVYEQYPTVASFVFSALLIPFYATFVATASLFRKFTWKERTQR